VILGRTTLSGRRVTVLATALAVLLGAAIGLGGQLAADGLAPSRAPVPEQAAADLPSEGDPDGDGARAEDVEEARDDAADGPPPAITTDEPPPPVAADVPAPRDELEPPDEVEQVEAQQVAADFAAGFASYRFDDGPDALLVRVSPYITAGLADRLGEGGSSGASLALREREEVGTGIIETVQVQAIGEDWMDLVAVVRIEVTAGEVSEQRWVSTLVRAVRTERGWRVDGFQP
jgi:hypothetical protein